LQIFCSPKRPARKGASSLLDQPLPAKHWALIIMLRIMLPTHGDGAGLMLKVIIMIWIRYIHLHSANYAGQSSRPDIKDLI
jgi:hypothetical protein